MREALQGGRMATWEDAKQFMQQNVLLQPHADEPVAINDTYVRNSNDFMKTDGSPDPVTAAVIRSWLRRNIGDEEVLAAVGDDKVELLARLVAATGARVGSLVSVFHKEHVERTLLDVGVLRFPNIGNPLFEAYRLQLHAWRHCVRTLASEENRNGLRVEFNCHKYVPCEGLLAGMTAAAIAKACDEADALFR